MHNWNERLRVGDYVFSPKGFPIEIIDKTDKSISDIEVGFSDGSIIKCNGEHLWTVYDRTARKEDARH